VVVLVVCAHLAAQAQSPARMPRIGLLSIGTEPAGPLPPQWIAFFDRLREQGYVDGRNIVVERRFAGGEAERVKAFAAELVQQNVDVIVVTGSREVEAARRATTTIPIVTIVAPDLVATGLEVLARRRAAATPAELGVVNLIAHHDEEANEQLAGDGHAGLGATAAMDQRAVDTVQVVIRASGQGSGLAEDPAKQRAALLGDLPQMTRIRRGAHCGRQAHVAHDVLAPREAGDGAQNQDGGEGGQGPHAGMSQQPASVGMGVSRVGDASVQAVDMRLEPGQELQAVLPALSGVMRQVEGGQLGAPALTPELGPQREAAIERNGLQAIFHHGADAHEAHAVSDEGAEIAGGRIRNPDRGEAFMLQQVEQVPGVAAVSLRLAHDHGPDLGGLADEQGVAEALKPQGVAGTLDADGHRAGQGAVELLHGISLVEQFLLHHFAGVGLKHGHLLLTGVQVTSDDGHERGLLSVSWATVPQPEPTKTGRPFS
jgi:hypothetical protein